MKRKYSQKEGLFKPFGLASCQGDRLLEQFTLHSIKILSRRMFNSMSGNKIAECNPAD